jgi:WD40 repeat protein
LLSVTERAGDRIGRYALLEEIGEGGFGVVYKAQQLEPVRRRVALKIIKLGMDTLQVVARFEAERQVLAVMDHPNIAKVLDGGATETGRPYFVMELVDGVRITRYADQHRLSTRERLALFVQVCRAIQHAHQKGIVHRDIKPSNILVAVSDGAAVPKVIDFGIAKATQGELTDKTIHTQLQQLMGTPAYMSPEQVELTGLDIDTRTDIYSLGVLLYELLVGKTPFDAKDLLRSGLDRMRRTIREQEPARPSTRLGQMRPEELSTIATQRHTDPPRLIHAVRGDLDWIVMRCLEKDRTRRYDTALDVAADVQRHLQYEPVVARPPSSAYRTQRFVRRHKGVVTAATAIAIVLMLGVIVSAWQAARAIRLAGEAGLSARQAGVSETKALRQRQRAETGEYAAQMNVAQQAWEQNNIDRVRQSLQETANYQQLGFEWYYWQKQIHLELRTIRGHIGGIRSVAFSPDGHRLVTGSQDHTAKVWDLATGQPLVLLTNHPGWVHSVAFSPDGQQVVTGSRDPIAWVCDAATGQRLFHLEGHTEDINSVAFSPDGRFIVTGSGDGTAIVWDVAARTKLSTLRGHTNGVTAVAFTPDSWRVVTGSRDRFAKVWDARTGGELLSLAGHRSEVTSVACSCNGQWIITGGGDAVAILWDATSGRRLRAFVGHSGPIWSVAFSADSLRVVTGSSDQTAKVWDPATGEQLVTLRGHSAEIRSVAFSPDGRQIATATGEPEGTAKIWSVANEDQPLTLTSHSGWLRCVAFSPDSRKIATGGLDPTGHVWDAVSRREVASLEGHAGNILAVGFSRDGRQIVTGSADRSVKVWDAASGQVSITLTGHLAPVLTVAFFPAGDRIVSGSGDKNAVVWNLANRRQEATLFGHSGRVRSVAVSPDGRWVITGSEDQTGRVWDVASRRTLLTLEPHAGEVRAVAFSSDGRYIVTGSSEPEGLGRVWDAITGKKLLELKGHKGSIWSVDFSPDGLRAVTAGEDETVRLWDVLSGKELLTFRGHTGSVRAVDFAPDGHQIATGSQDGTAKVWLAATPEQVAAWQKEESEAETVLDGLRQKRGLEAERARASRAKDPGAIKQWLVLAPIPLEGKTKAAAIAALEQEQIPHESRLQPHAGEQVLFGSTERQWTPALLTDYDLDFNQLLGEEPEYSVAYAVCYILSDAAKSELTMRIGSDDEAKAYLNGEEVYRWAETRSYLRERDVRAGLKLRPGVNVLVLKVINETQDWLASVRVADADGQPVKGIFVTLNPPESNKP